MTTRNARGHDVAQRDQTWVFRVDDMDCADCHLMRRVTQESNA